MTESLKSILIEARKALDSGVAIAPGSYFHEELKRFVDVEPPTCTCGPYACMGSNRALLAGFKCIARTNGHPLNCGCNECYCADFSENRTEKPE